ncbi:hypothetical protein BH11PLA2_BH11PLA2_13630 [soil metagenome]
MISTKQELQFDRLMTQAEIDNLILRIGVTSGPVELGELFANLEDAYATLSNIESLLAVEWGEVHNENSILQEV